MYKKMSDECRKDLEEQFNFSEKELDHMESFISSNMGKTTREILDTIMKDDSLNNKQRVLISYTIGVSIGEDNMDQELKDIQNAKPELVMNIRIGQGG